jgi:hypothetical protein
MTSTNELLAKFGYEIELPKGVGDCHPHLEDKMVVDLINGLEVAGDHIKVSESRHKPLNRLIDGVTGKGKQRQDKINKNLSEGLKTASIWLQKHESDFIQVNLALGTFGNKLLETRAGVMKLDSKIGCLKDYLLDFEKVVKDKQTELGTYIQDVDLRTKADAHIAREFDFWAGGKMENLPVEMRVFTIIDNLRNGSFALFLHQKATQDEKGEYLKHLGYKLRSAVAKDLNIKSTDELFKNQWFNLSKVNNKIESIIEKESIIYLSSWATDKIYQPTVFTINAELSSQDKNLPMNHNMLRWMDRNIEEQLGVIR